MITSVYFFLVLLGNFTCLAIVFNLRRRLGYHLFHTYIPSALIVVMSWISFWIKPEAIPARVTLGVTSLLTLGNYISCFNKFILARIVENATEFIIMIEAVLAYDHLHSQLSITILLNHSNYC